ncbi:maltoporin [Vibrio sp. HA2012]|uniref:carbohydrate porin n=1 Tax=Vibrio sp. HA2012 TaxID=1971595 RepID=UPI000C2C15AB|nr:carbohydrate porin [Vibrio sp. HA2012]PJC86933.1 maltoporin [Vibrio sp. HA2012]
MKKVSVLAAAVATAFVTGSAFAAEKVNGTDVITDGWEVHGYASMNVRQVDGETTDNEYGKPDYKTAGTLGRSTNQVEITVKKHTEHANGVWSDFVVRSEYGNGNSYAYSSSGGQKSNDENQFEVKETFIEIGALPYLGEDTSVWAGQRFLNRSSGLLSGEFWKQSSGVGAGIQTKISGNTAGFAVMEADPDAGYETHNAERTTLTSHDLYLYGVDIGIGRLDFDLKYIKQANTSGTTADDGVGASITLNSSYYGLDGWAQSAIAYGEDAATHRVNFGQWSGGTEGENSIFLTSYGVLNISDKWQMGSEVTYLGTLDELWGTELTRYLLAVRPSYKVNDNLRLEFTASYGYEEVGDEGDWSRSGDAVEGSYINLEIATPLTVNADFFGRPQIKPYISYIKADDEESAAIIGISDDDKEVIVGVHAEIWF